jgi:tetratricopeptide (TPR) repeat protein
VEELRGELANVRAMSNAGKFRDAAPLAKDLAAKADETGYAPLQGEASYVDGVLRARTGDLPGAEASLYRALRAADAAGDDKTRVEVYGSLIYYVGDAEAKRDLIPIFRDEAKAALAREGGDPRGEAQIAQTMGAVLLGEGKYDEALDEDRKALELWKTVRGPESNEVARTLGNMGVAYEAAGRADDALEYHEKSRVLEEKELGPDHPDLAKTWHNLGDVHLLKMEFKQAEAAFQRADDIAEAALGPDHPLVARCLDGLADAVIELGDAPRAVALHERALAIKEKALGPNNPVLFYSLLGLGEALIKVNDYARAREVVERALALPSTGNDRDAAAAKFALARALAGEGKAGKRPRELAEQARDAYVKSGVASPGEKHNLDEVNAWLAANP